MISNYHNEPVPSPQEFERFLAGQPAWMEEVCCAEMRRVRSAYESAYPSAEAAQAVCPKPYRGAQAIFARTQRRKEGELYAKRKNAPHPRAQSALGILQTDWRNEGYKLFEEQKRPFSAPPVCEADT